VYESACLIDLTDYPYDRQTCDMWFQSLSYSSIELDLQTYDDRGFDLDAYNNNFKKADEWEVLSNYSARFQTPGDVGEGLMFRKRVALRMTLTLKRRKGFSSYLLCVPCVVLASMTVLVFIMPPERADRTGLGTTLLRCFLLLLLIHVETAPPSAASVPKISLLYGANMAVVILSLVLSSIVGNISQKGTNLQPFPKYLFPVTQWMTTVFCIPFNHTQSFEMQLSDKNLTNLYELDKFTSISTETQISRTVEQHEDGDSVPEILQQIDQTVGIINTSLAKAHAQISETKGSEWTSLAAALDRLFLSCQCILVIVITSILYPKTYHMEHHELGSREFGDNL